MVYAVGSLLVLVVAVALVPTIAGALPGSYASTFRRLVAAGLSRPQPAQELLADADLAPLPAPVQTYLRRTGSLGKPKVHDFHALMYGDMTRQQGDTKALPFTAEQYSFLDAHERLFFMRSNLFGIPFDGLHVFTPSAGASMRINVAAVAQVVDAHGGKMNQSETVTYLNDLCFLAPAALIDPAIKWEELDAHHVKAVYTKDGVTVSAVLTFDAAGDLVDFYSDDRYMSADGTTYLNYRWSTPISEYHEFADGRRIATHGVAKWATPAGEYEYIRFNIRDITYNVAAR